jgi:AmpD protein
VHCISLPPGRFRGDAVERLFTNRLDWKAHPYFETLRGLRVSAHFFIRRNGAALQFVSCDQRAWHAGASLWRGRADCNDFSIGIELEGTDTDNYTVKQYRKLATLLRELVLRYPLVEAAGHEHVAPLRKTDPGPGFEWQRLRKALRGIALQLPHGA